MPRPLSDTRVRILRQLDYARHALWSPETAKEIAIGCGEACRASDWATGALREMASGVSGPPLVRRVGVSMWSNAATWTITDAGREALAAAEREER